MMTGIDLIDARRRDTHAREAKAHRDGTGHCGAVLRRDDIDLGAVRRRRGCIGLGGKQ